MSKMSVSIIFLVFIMTFTASIIFMPDEIAQSGYQAPNWDIPDQFSAYEMLDKEIGIFHQIAVGTDVDYDFEAIANTTFLLSMNWKAHAGTPIHLREKYLYGGFIPYVDLIAVFYRANLVNSFGVDQANVSIERIRTWRVNVDIYFEDSNGARNDIGQAFDAGLINCTMVVPTVKDVEQRLGAREIILAIMMFNIPTVYYTVHPMLGFLISVIFYVPIAFIFFNVMMWALHGD